MLFLKDTHVLRESDALLEARVAVLRSPRLHNLLTKERARVNRRGWKVSEGFIEHGLRGEVRVSARTGFLEILPTARAARLEPAPVSAASPVGALLLCLEHRVGLLPFDSGYLVCRAGGRGTARVALVPMDDDHPAHVVELDISDRALLVEALHDVLHGLWELREQKHRANEFWNVNRLRFEFIEARDDFVNRGRGMRVRRDVRRKRGLEMGIDYR